MKKKQYKRPTFIEWMRKIHNNYYSQRERLLEAAKRTINTEKTT